jgi:hypothetical protein
MWQAGSGIRPGPVVGESDDFGFNSVRDHAARLNVCE